MADQIATFSSSLLTCLQQQFDLLPAAVRPAHFEHVAGILFVEDIDPYFGKDKCCEGTGWVRVGDTYPSSSFPEPDLDVKANSCLPVAWAQALDVGVARCYPGYGRVQGPSALDHQAARDRDLLDMQTIKKAICCWAKTLVPKGTLYQVTNLAVTGPSGVCVSRIASILVGVGKCC